MLKCSNCGAEINAGMKFCGECGAQIPQTRECPSCHQQLALSIKFCGNCGYNLCNSSQSERGELVKCKSCGGSVSVQDAAVCSECQGYVCREHYDSGARLCADCMSRIVRVMEKIKAEESITEAELKPVRVLARRGNAAAQNCLANCYLEGIGVEEDYEEAFIWYQKAAEQGYVEALFGLGLCYVDGMGVEEDEEEAVKWFRMAAELGNADGQNWLAYCYEKGLGVDRNEEEAVRWYRKAAKQGQEGAQQALVKLGVEES